MAEARRIASTLASASSGTVSGESDNGATRKKPRAEASGNGKASSLDLPVAFEGLVVTPPPEPSLFSHPNPRRQRQETASYSPRSHRKGIRVESKKLFEATKPVQSPEWTQEELKQLVEFMLLYTDGKTWAQHKDMRFWGAAGEFIQRCLQTLYCRSGKQ